MVLQKKIYLYILLGTRTRELVGPDKGSRIWLVRWCNRAYCMLPLSITETPIRFSRPGPMLLP